jgi:hypothetical protein
VHKRKKFDQELHDKYDKIAREKAKNFLSTQGLVVVDNLDKYGVDLLCHRGHLGKVVGYCEVEVKRVWKGYQWPSNWDSVQWPAGKKKFAELDKPTLFFMLNALHNRALYTTGEQLITSPVVEVPNIYEKKDELFYQVPITEVTFVDV